MSVTCTTKSQKRNGYSNCRNLLDQEKYKDNKMIVDMPNVMNNSSILPSSSKKLAVNFQKRTE